MTSSNGNIFRVTGPLWGEFTSHRWIPRTKASDAEVWCFLWSAPWINDWVNNREAGELRRHRTHDDVIVMQWNAPQFIALEPASPDWGSRAGFYPPPPPPPPIPPPPPPPPPDPHPLQLPHHSSHDRLSPVTTRAPFQYKDSLTRYGISIIKIRQSHDRLIFIMGIPILTRQYR